MGWRSKPAAPPAPNYTELAHTQAKLDKEATDTANIANRPNQYTPEGSLEWTRNPDGTWAQTVKYSPEYQALHDANMNVQGGLARTGQGMLDRVAGSVSTPFNYEGMPQVQDYDFSKLPGFGMLDMNNLPELADVQGLDYSKLPGLADYGKGLDFSKLPELKNFSNADFTKRNPYGNLDMSNLTAREGYGNLDLSKLTERGPLGEFDISKLPELAGSGFGSVKEVSDAMMGLMQPGLEQGRAREIQRLKAQGITEGSPAWNAAMRNLGDVDTDAQNKALLAGTAEYGNVFNRSLQGRQQALTEALKKFEAGDTNFARTMAARGQDLGEAQAAYGAEGDRFDRSLRARGQDLGEAQAAFEAGDTNYQRSLAARDQDLREADTMFENAYKARQLGMDEAAAQFESEGELFNRSRAARDVYRGEERDLYGARGDEFDRSMQRRTNAVNERSLAANYANTLRGLMLGEQGLGRQASGENRNRAIEEALRLRQLPLDELSAFMSGTQTKTPSFSSYSSAGKSNPADIYGAAKDDYKTAMDEYNAKMASKDSMVKGLFGMGGSLLGSFGGPFGAKLGGMAGDFLGKKMFG